ncbi:U2 snRNP-associated SURP motif-containing protein-like [Xenia sp. Carnegie-2017]|uniref:U2 snRNP-associated SURP motif-containing protein-like n=1 Tax=Xenia sp. Carnegie-2017 TaxID=2897299 RepID=UPI001F04D678|nr:U2 snRNP-associated SURP motif-containing protein-like [Xenia sp. Carnegie-2017]XP_046851922.1 U2 snRNP-associated SURP motif-containing protein-like [Xenia sp. Carnegie-2017]XP_046851923.1 U2 snRNP-associated SURP motif-containing protein-like [Xenia sp. Carnegie-2017]
MLKKVKPKQEIEQKKKVEEANCAEVYEKFVASFEGAASKGKTFVRGNVVNPGQKKEILSEKSGELYTLKAFQQDVSQPLKPAVNSKTKIELKKRKEKEKKKSNLELFKEELKKQQEEREIRHKLKKGDISDIPSEVFDNFPTLLATPQKDEPYTYGSYDTGDPNTTNLYIGNISPEMNEEQLMKLFGQFGPLASVKIMWPRTEEEKSRNRNCGFVAFMKRKDGDKAISALKGKDIKGYEMKLGWGKAVPIPPHPIYIPPEMQEANKPPPPSGLPFNAQPGKVKENDEQSEIIDMNGISSKTLANAVVKVVIPTERPILHLIHRTIEFVILEGPIFEAMIMNRELNNPQFRFLFDNQSPEHIYYRWKLFSILQGDSQTKWKTKEFRMFKNGSVWRPPNCTSYIGEEVEETVVETVVEKKEEKKVEPSKPSRSTKKGLLSDRNRDKLENMLRELVPERSKISEFMTWCIDHADAADEICDCMSEALSILETPPNVKVARLFAVSDVLYNCTAKVRNASFYRRSFERKLPEIFERLNETFQAVKTRMKAEQFRKQVLKCLAAWTSWAIYPPDFLVNLQNIFLGQGQKSITDQFIVSRSRNIFDMEHDDDVDLPSDIDGFPLSKNSSDIDGVPLDDLDGVPMDDIDGKPLKVSPTHIPSKWDNPEITSKWDNSDTMESKWERIKDQTSTSEVPKEISVEATALKDRDEEKRKRLREVEIKVAKYSDKLESSGKETPHSIKEKVEQYRQQLLEESEPRKSKKKKRHSSPSEKRKSRSRSLSVSRDSSSSSSPTPPNALTKSMQSLKGYDSPSSSPRNRSPSPSAEKRRRDSSPRRKSSKKRRSKSRSPKSMKKAKRKDRSRSRSPSKSSKKSR